MLELSAYGYEESTGVRQDYYRTLRGTMSKKAKPRIGAGSQPDKETQADINLTNALLSNREAVRDGMHSGRWSIPERFFCNVLVLRDSARDPVALTITCKGLPLVNNASF